MEAQIGVTARRPPTGTLDASVRGDSGRGVADGHEGRCPIVTRASCPQGPGMGFRGEGTRDNVETPLPGLGGAASREACMKLSHTARAATVVVALLTAFVAGCDEDDGPTSIPPSDSPSAPESSEPTEPTTTPTETGPVEPTLPTDAEPETKAGRRRSWSTTGTSSTTHRQPGTTELLASVSIENCDGCDGGMRSIDRIYRRGGRIIGGRNRVIRRDLLPTPSGGWR